LTQTAAKAPAANASANTAPAGNAPANKAQTDNAPLSVEEFAGKAAAKVALDIDDAPFLVEEKAKPPEPVREAEEPKPDTSAEDAARAAKALRRRKILIGFGLFVVLMLLVAAALWFFIFREVPATTQTTQPGATVVVVPNATTITGPTKIPVTFEDFWVPQKDKTGAVRFLRVHFSTEVVEEKFAKEISDKTLVLRDAVYYYLRNKPHEYMMEADNLPTIKQDVVDILNNYLTQGKVEDLFLENFLMR
jgi:flagellar FliL protein